MSYDAFVSYSHKADSRLAPALERTIERLGKPWYRRRVIEVYRDETNLQATPHLWDSITEAMDQSKWFILMASPEAAESDWVNKEINYWNKKPGGSPDSILIVLTSGTLEWNANAGRFTPQSTALPPALRGKFAQEPKYVDLAWVRNTLNDEDFDAQGGPFRAAAADVASAIRGIPKDELESEDLRQHRRAVHVRQLAVGLLLALTAALALASCFAVRQRNTAEGALADLEDANGTLETLDTEIELAQTSLDQAQDEIEVATTDRDNAIADSESAAAERDAASRLRDIAVVERDAATLERERATVERDSATAERSDAVRLRDIALIDRDAASSERDTAISERTIAVGERDAAAGARDLAIGERDVAAGQRDTAIGERDMATDARDTALGERDTAVDERDAAADQRDTALGERDMAVDERDAAADQRDLAFGERDTAIDERDMATDARDMAIDERDMATDARDMAIDERDMAIDDRDMAIDDRDMAIDDRDMAIDDRDMAIDDRDTAKDARDVAIAAEADSRRRTNALTLAAQSQTLRQRNPALAMRLAVASLDLLTFGEDRDNLSDLGLSALRESRSAIVEARVAFASSPGHQLGGLLSGASDGVQDGRFLAHEDPVNEMAYNPDGTRLASAAGEDGNSSGDEVLIWDTTVSPPRPLVALDHGQPAWDVAYSGNGQKLAVSGLDHSLTVWNVGSPLPPWSGTKLPALEEGHGEKITAVAFNESGRWLASGDTAGNLRLWDLNPNPPQVTTLASDASVWSLAFSSDEGDLHLASGHGNGEVLIWSIESPMAEPVSLSGHDGRVYGLSFSPEQADWLASGSWDGTVRWWDIKTTESRLLTTHQSTTNERVDAVDFGLDGVVVSVGRDNAVRVSDASAAAMNAEEFSATDEAQPYQIGQPMRGHTDSVYSVAMTKTPGIGPFVSSGAFNSNIRTWELTGGDLGRLSTSVSDEFRFGQLGENVDAVAIVRQGTRAVSGAASVNLHNLTEEPRVLEEERSETVAIDPTGERAAWVRADGRTVVVRELASGQGDDFTLDAGDEGILALALGAGVDGEVLLAAAGIDKVVRFWTVGSDAAAPVVLQGHTDHVLALAFNDQGSRLISGSRDNTARLWDLQDGNTTQLSGHIGPVTAVAFSADQSYVITASSDDTLRLWGAIDGGAIGSPIPDRMSDVIALTGIEGGLLTVNEKGEVRRWDDLLSRDRACAVAATRFIDPVLLDTVLESIELDMNEPIGCVQ